MQRAADCAVGMLEMLNIPTSFAIQRFFVFVYRIGQAVDVVVVVVGTP